MDRTSAFDIAMMAMLTGGLIGAAVLGAIAVNRRTAGWLLGACLALLMGSIPLLLGGVGVFGIAVATILAGFARTLPGYHRLRWIARGLAIAAAAGVATLQIVGARGGIKPSVVDWLLVGLAAVMLIVTLVPTKPNATQRAIG